MLAVEEIRLLRSVVEWRRANGWMFGFYPTRGEAAWRSDRWLVEADIYPDSVRLNVDDETSRRLSLRPASVREAVDVLAALSVLPATFSSAWRTGRESAYPIEQWAVRYHQGVGIHWGRAWTRENAAESLTVARRHWPDAWLEYRRTGATEWERVDADV